MSRMLGRLLNIRPEEGMKVFMLVMIFFLFITGTAWAETIDNHVADIITNSWGNGTDDVNLLGAD